MTKQLTCAVIMTIMTVSAASAASVRDAKSCRERCRAVLEACRQKPQDDCTTHYKECLKECPSDTRERDGMGEDESLPQKEQKPETLVPEIIEKPH